MARIGLNNFRLAPATVGADGAVSYGKIMQPAKAVSFSFEPTIADASLYADDALAESDNRVTGGDVTMGIASADLKTMGEILGHTVSDEGEETANSNDTAGYWGVGRVTRLMLDGKQKFRATVLSLVKFQEPSDDESTMADSVEFGTYELAGKMSVPANGVWRVRQTFDTQAEAIAFIEKALGKTAGA